MSSRNRVRVLIADDHQLFAEALITFISLDDGFEVVAHARDGCEALELAAAFQPDLVLMDLHMPRLDGLEATRRLGPLCPEARVVIVTASAAPDDRARARAAGAVDYLTKDRPAHELLEAMTAASRSSLTLAWSA